MNKADIEEMNAASERLANLMSSFVSPELVQRLNAIDSSPTEDGVFRSKARMLEIIKAIPVDCSMFQRAHSLATLIKHESDGEALRLSTLNQMPLMNLRVVKLQMRISEFKIEDESDPDNYQGALNKQMKGKRMSLDPNRKAFLENAFQMQPFPNRKDRELLAKKTGMTSVQVRIWFTNKRMRVKLFNTENDVHIYDHCHKTIPQKVYSERND